MKKSDSSQFDAEIAEIINLFIQQLPGKFTEICESYEARNFPRLSELLHDLKGSSGNFGYDKLYSIARHMEQAAKDGLIDELGIMLQEAEKIVQSVILHPEQSSMSL